MRRLRNLRSSELGRATLSDYWQFFVDLATGRRTNGEMCIAEQRQKDCERFLNWNTPLLVLDLANGSLSPQMEILARQGHQAVGLDFVNLPVRSIKTHLYRLARILFRFWLPHSRQSGGSASVYGTVARLPFADNTFDLITSIAAFEHFLDVPKVVAEAYRVLKPGGLIWVGLHPFTALSGGHNVGLRLGPVTKLPDGVEPWDHLRKRQVPFSVPLNEWRIEQYEQEFLKHFTILHTTYSGVEGRDLLTPQIRAELQGYSVEELTHNGFIICARKQ